MRIGNKVFDTDNNCYIMGILNVTPDSFSDGGKYSDTDRALFHTEEMIKAGMDILDIGGESTRPGYTPVSIEEEISRTAPIIAAVKERFDVPVSLDTYKHTVARAGIEAGADLINDIWGLRFDSGEMASLIAEKEVACCLMHNRRDTCYTSFFEDMLSDMRKTLDIAGSAGISQDRIMLDPGVGFAKSYEQNLEAIRRLDEFSDAFGLPVLLGTSRKSVIGLTLDLPAQERVEGTVATSVIGVMKGAAFLRVHDITENIRAVKMTQAVMKGNRIG